jgi:hypothetical protein
LGQFSAELGHDDVHASLADRISHHGSKASDTSELDVATLAGNEYNLLLFAVTNETEEGVDDVDVADQVVFDVLINLLLQRFLLATTAQCQQFELSSALGPFTHKALGGSALVSGPAEPALRIKTSSEPAVTLETSAAAWCNFFGSEISVTTIWMFLRFAASSSSGPAVPRLRMMANTWFFGSTDFGGAVSGMPLP